MTMIYTVAIGLTIGATALVSRRTGEHDTEGAARAAGQSILLGLGIAAVLGLGAAPFAPSLLRAMGASDGVVRTGTGFTTLMLAGNATVLLLFLQNAVFRGAGDAATAMRVLVLGNLLNIVLGPCFIFGLGPFPELGVTGAAVATNTGRGTAVLYQFYLLTRGKRRVRLARRHLTVDLSMMRAGTPAFRVRDIPDSDWHGQLRWPRSDSVDVRQRRARRVHDRDPCDPVCPAAGIRDQQCGCDDGRPEPRRGTSRSRRTGRLDRRAVQHAVSRFRRADIPACRARDRRSLHHDPAVAPFAVSCLRIVSLGFVFYACGMVLTQAFNGAGDTWTPTIINLFVFWLLEIPLAWWLSTRGGFGARGVFVALTVAYSALAVVSAVWFRRGAWKTSRV